MSTFFTRIGIALFLVLLTPGIIFAQVVTNPEAAGHPEPVFYDNSQFYDNTVNYDNSVIQQGGPVQEIKVGEIKKPVVREPLLLDIPGVGDMCTIGVPKIVPWQLVPGVSITTKENFKQILETAVVSDTRLRRITIADNRIDMYYLMPARRLKIFPINYQLHIIGDATTFRMSLENPKWVARVPNKHSVVTEAFTAYVPVLLDEQVVASYKDAPLMMRDAKLIEVIARVMQEAKVLPNTGTFFSCYIMPFLAYIIGAVILALILIWYMIRHIRKLHRKRRFLGLGSIGEEDEDDDEHGGHSPLVRYVPGNSDQ
jgi:hypothetical protein